jgi:hypothetical protein
MSEAKGSTTKSRIIKILVVIIILLAIVRIALPHVLLYYANKSLSNMKGYHGHIEDIDLALYRGAYKIDSIYLNKVDSVSKNETPFFSSDHIDLSIEWKAIFHGSIVGELVFESPTLIFTKEKVEPSTLEKDSADFKDLLKGFMPLQVNRFEINQGMIRYADQGSTPPVDIAMTNVHVLAQNLRNSYDSTVLLPAKVNATASVCEGVLNFNMKLNPLADQATFDLNTELTDTNLIELNEFFQAYAKVDVNNGVFGMYAEAAAKDGKFTGYVKPIIKDLDILGKEDRDDNIFRKMWEGFVGAVGQVFKNQSKDQVATKVSFQGDFDNPNTDVLSAVFNVLRNAFIQALQPAIDNEINIMVVAKPDEKKPTFLQRVFGKRDDRK